MFLTLAILAGVALLLVVIDRFGAESRPDFLDPRRKHGPFITPFRVRSTR
jgi:hypothetical protein